MSSNTSGWLTFRETGSRRTVQSRNSNFSAPTQAMNLIDGYAQMAENYEQRGWSGYFVAFMFNPIRGSKRKVAAAMQDEVERVYATLVTRVVRDPRSPQNRDCLPFLLASPDYPIFKYDRQSIHDVAVNEGRHFHSVIYFPPNSRLHEDPKLHLGRNGGPYIRSDRPLSRIDVKPITRTPGRVVDYAFKWLKRGLVDPDEILVLPKALSELPSLQNSAWWKNAG
jgi:hypothetical protein